MGRSFCGIPSKHTQDWAANNHMLQTGLSFAENFCNKTPKKFSKICQNRFSEVKETINFKNFRGAAPNPAGGLTAPPPAGFLVGIHIKIIPLTLLPYIEHIRHRGLEKLVGLLQAVSRSVTGRSSRS